MDRAVTENLIEFKFPGDPLLWTVYFNLAFNSILPVIFRRRFRFGFKLHFTVLPGLVPCILWKEKVARQLVALCLVSSLGHNTCVFLSDQPDVPCRQAVAGDVVLNLRRHWTKQRRLKLKCRRRERADITLYGHTWLTCCSVIFWGRPRIITVLFGVACRQSSSPGDLEKIMRSGRSIQVFRTFLCIDHDFDLYFYHDFFYCPHQLFLSMTY